MDATLHNGASLRQFEGLRSSLITSAGDDAGLSQHAGFTLDPTVLRELHALQGTTSTVVDELIAVFETQATMLIAHMRWASEQSDATELYFAANRLRGSSTTIGGMLLAHLCMLLEVEAKADNLETTSRHLARIEQECAHLMAALDHERIFLRGFDPQGG